MVGTVLDNLLLPHQACVRCLPFVQMAVLLWHPASASLLGCSCAWEQASAVRSGDNPGVCTATKYCNRHRRYALPNHTPRSHSNDRLVALHRHPNLRSHPDDSAQAALPACCPCHRSCVQCGLQQRSMRVAIPAGIRDNMLIGHACVVHQHDAIHGLILV
jgi:hypothetical protein